VRFTNALPQFLDLINELLTGHPVEVVVHDISPGLSTLLRRDADA
jgi:23S rRNA U2552 (ribose-2'-O)-methylase RlmE/FtsJ